MLNIVFIIKEFENIREYKNKMKMKLINFETSIDSFYRFFSKKSISENVYNSKSKNQFLNFNDNLIKTLIKIFRDFFNDFDETSFCKSSFKSDMITRIAFQR